MGEPVGRCDGAEPDGGAAASGGGALAQLVRAQQDAVAEQRGLDKALVEELSKPIEQRAAAREQGLRKRMGELDRRLAELNARIGAEFPDYAGLASPQPLSVGEVQQLLGADEALVFLLTGDKESYVFALTREGFEWKTIPLGARGAGAESRGVPPRARCRRAAARIATGWSARRPKRTSADCRASECGRVVAKECEEARHARPGACRLQRRRRPRELFDLGLAHELYETLIGPVEALIRDKRHLIVVPSGALTALPFHLLVTEKPAVAVPQVECAARSRGLSRRRLAAQAPCRERAAVGGEPQGAARVRAQG